MHLVVIHIMYKSIKPSLAQRLPQQFERERDDATIKLQKFHLILQPAIIFKCCAISFVFPQRKFSHETPPHAMRVEPFWHGKMIGFHRVAEADHQRRTIKIIAGGGGIPLSFLSPREGDIIAGNSQHLFVFSDMNQSIFLLFLASAKWDDNTCPINRSISQMIVYVWPSPVCLRLKILFLLVFNQK